MTPGFAKPRSELPWLPYGEVSRVIINSHNFTPQYLYPSLRTTPPAIGYYARLDAGAAATDQFTADGSQNGTLQNGASRVDNSGLSYSFSDASSQHISGTQSIAGASKVTMSFWGRKSATGKVMICSLGAETTNSRFNMSWFSDGNVYCTAENGSISTGFFAESFSLAWRHFALVFDGTASGNSNRLKAYVNGVQKTLTFSGTIPATAIVGTAIGVGRGSGVFADGLVDDFLVYSGVSLDATNVGYLAAQRGAIYATA